MQHLRTNAWLSILALSVAWSSPSKAEDFNVLGDGAERLLAQYVLDQLDQMYDRRRQDVEAALKSPEALKQYQQELRRRYFDLIGPLPPKTPLEPIVTGTIECDGYRIEKVAFQSRPNHHVTANFYIPDGDGPFPGILVPCGHSGVRGKGSEAYQQAAILMAKNGLAALVVDPFSQGERSQLLDKEGRRTGPENTVGHSLVDNGAILVGWDSVVFELWDNIRAIDYLISRPEVDAERIGLSGNSGGGTQTAYLMAYDDRIGPAAPSCFISSQQSILHALGSQDGCQQLAGDAAAGIEHASYATMRAPKPTIILAADRDFFSIEAARETVEEMRRVYTVLGHPDRTDLFSYNDRHGWSKPRREAAVRWMRRWLLDDDSPVKEGESTVHPVRKLRATKTGQVATHFPGERTVVDLTLRRARELEESRKRFWSEGDESSRRAEIAKLIALRTDQEPTKVESAGRIQREGYTIDKLILTRADEPPVPGLLFVPAAAAEDRRRPAVLYLDGRGKSTDAGPDGPIAQLVADGRIVLAIDARGFGETTDRTRTSRAERLGGIDYVVGMPSLQLGRPLLGQRVEDVLAARRMLAAHGDVDPTRIELIGIDQAGPVALHAAYLDEGFAKLTLRDSITSWIDDLVAKPRAENMIGQVVPRALLKYDLPDLHRAIENRKPKTED